MIFDKDYELSDKYELSSGRVYMTGIQALVRLPLMQKQLDQKNGLNTAGFISGYRGSPLGAYDMELWRNKEFLAKNDVHFEPAINEDLGATAVWGTQLIDVYRQDANRDGVFAYWYGKAHGVDRSADVFRQGNVQGTAKHGGVLAFCGDDHAAESSTFSHQTDQIFEAAIMPILYPSNVQEYLSMGLAGIALSRYSGLWVAFKTISETVESGSSVLIPELSPFVVPDDFAIPAHGLNYDVNLKWPAERLEYERRMIEERAMAAHAFVYANKIDKTIFQSTQKRFGLVTLGKAHGDLMEALAILGLNEQQLEQAGISIYKVGMSWPLEPKGIREFAQGMQSLFVVEEKRPQLEKQIKEQLYNWPMDRRPEIFGKRDWDNKVLLPEVWTLSPEIVADALEKWLSRLSLQQLVKRTVETHIPTPINKLISRAPYFCAGCPHNSSTKLPDGSISGAGIGCHIMVLSQDRQTKTFTQMGGEGIHWVGLAPFSKRKHMFQNLGDGTYQHSGSLAVRQAVISNVNLTFKLLYNDAVAMVGGQAVEGHPSPSVIARQMLAEGVKKVALVSDDITKFTHDKTIPEQVTLHDRQELETVQKQFREIEGVTMIIYEQTCAAEKRRRRKKGVLEDPNRRLFINHRVCEGCGDCSFESNCIAVEPKETPFGRKRQINQSSCNKDFSCVNGFCPSFVSVIDGATRKPETQSVIDLEASLLTSLPVVSLPSFDRVYSVLIAGIGGSGVLTIGALISTAAHLEGKGTSTLDFTGLSQKNGSVTAHVKVAHRQEDIHIPRIINGGANLLLACDMVSALPSLVKVGQGYSHSVINTSVVSVPEFVQNNDLQIPVNEMKEQFIQVGGQENTYFIEATNMAENLFGDSIATNLFMVGYAWQRGLLPLHSESIERAIELNGVAVQLNLRAFRWGRLAAHDPAAIDNLIKQRQDKQVISLPDKLDDKIEFYRHELVEYQNQAYANRFTQAIKAFESAEIKALGSATRLTPIAAKYLYKLMAYKDEYEVARLYTSDEFTQNVKNQFDGKYRLQFHLAPPLLSRKDPLTGHPKKQVYGPWVLSVFKVLAKMKALRGTSVDIFARTQERKAERQLIVDYIQILERLALTLKSFNADIAADLLSVPEKIKGYGHIKEKNMAQAQKHWADLWLAFDQAQGAKEYVIHEVRRTGR